MATHLAARWRAGGQAPACYFCIAMLAPQPAHSQALRLHLYAPLRPADRDLKSGNLLVDSLWHVKVADFSLSRALEMGTVAFTVVSTNPRCVAPGFSW